MPEIINIISVVFFLLCWLLIILRIISTRISSVKSVKAEVVDKYESTLVSNYPGTQSEKYIVVFKSEKKKLSFNVSEFTYGDYRIGEKGTLKYKGNIMISFE